MSDTNWAFTRDDVKVLSTDLPGDHRGHWWHVQIGDRYFVVSAVDLSFGGFVIDGYRTSETMAFEADAEGEVADWGELAMVPYKDHEACIADLLGELNELSTPVPVSEGSQVSGEVGPGGSGPNLAATGAGNGPGGVVPVPVAAQPRYILDAPAILDMVGRYAEACVEAATTGSPKGREDAREQIRDLWHAIRAALTPVPNVEPEPAWGSGPLVDHNLETPGTGSAYPAKYGYCAQCGAEPGQSCHYMFGDDEHEPNSVRPEPHFYRDSPGDDPNWRNLSAYKAPGTGSADPDGLRTQREMDADLYENWVANQEAGTGSAVPDREGIERRDRLTESWAEDD